MCLLIVKPAGKTIPSEYLHNAATGNKDGAGFAAGTGAELIIEKGFWTVAGLEEALEPYNSHPCIVHFRFATHGKVCQELCHPFSVNAEWAMGHNGVIQFQKLKLATNGEFSDSRVYAEQVIRYYLAQDPTYLDSARQTITAETAGSKLAFQHISGRQIVTPDKSGWIEEDGILYSNSSFRPYIFPHFITSSGKTHLSKCMICDEFKQIKPGSGICTKCLKELMSEF